MILIRMAEILQNKGASDKYYSPEGIYNSKSNEEILIEIESTEFIYPRKILRMSFISKICRLKKKVCYKDIGVAYFMAPLPK